MNDVAAIVSALMLYGTDAYMCCDSPDAVCWLHKCRLHSSTFCPTPTVYFSHKTATIIWTIKSKLPASLTRGKLSCIDSLNKNYK